MNKNLKKKMIRSYLVSFVFLFFLFVIRFFYDIFTHATGFFSTRTLIILAGIGVAAMAGAAFIPAMLWITRSVEEDSDGG